MAKAKKTPRKKKRHIKDALRDAMNEIQALVPVHPLLKPTGCASLQELASRILKPLDEDHPIHDSDHQGPIRDGILHEDIDTSEITITNISGGDVTIAFRECIWDEWYHVSPNGQTIPAGGSHHSENSVESDRWDGDHELAISCADHVTYHLRFESKDV